MDVDGFDPYEDEYEWRDALETMGEAFQEKLAEKGVKRQFWREKKAERVKELTDPAPILPGTVIQGADGAIRVYGNGEWKPYTGQSLEELVDDDDDDWVPQQERWHFSGF